MTGESERVADVMENDAWMASTEREDRPRADRVSETEVLAGGRWSSGDEDYSEQVRAADYVQDRLEFSTSYEYDSERFEPPNRLPVATVRGFWLRETERGWTEEDDVEFCVLLELDDGETCTVAFSLRGPGSAGAVYLETFLKSLGVGSDSVIDILGRKVYYKRMGAERDTEVEFKFFNTYRTYVSILSQVAGMGFAGLGILMFFGAVVYPMLLWAMLAGFAVGVVLMALPLVRDCFDRSAISAVKRYQVEWG